MMSNDGLIIENVDLSRIHLAVLNFGASIYTFVFTLASICLVLYDLVYDCKYVSQKYYVMLQFMEIASLFQLNLGCYHLKLLILDYISNQVRVVTD